MSDDLDPRPTRTRTAWETEHEDDPPDDVERFDEVPLPGVEVDPVDWIEVAREFRRERDYWRDRAHSLADDLADLQDRYLGRRHREETT